MPEFDQTATIAAGAGTTIVKAHSGRVRNVLVTAAGTGSGNVVVYDSVAAASGTILAEVPATVSNGMFYSFCMPAALGIVVSNPANGPALTISFD